jgi:DNA topoisomerase-1
VQDAHEAIRVIDPFLTPEDLKTKIGSDEFKLYELI